MKFMRQVQLLFTTFKELLTFSEMFSPLTLERIREGGRGVARGRTNTLRDLGWILRQQRSDVRHLSDSQLQVGLGWLYGVQTLESGEWETFGAIKLRFQKSGK